ncbi:hypothetical protein CCACVL1_26683 [Corchorus capsularis]|uniref:Cyanobacterial aminoacyl-tRNA synthetase CAAD domain-containing protein n=1 Tax=Corchorus capsularis TaxID=210143 RepID=A0A1R3GDS1_COCAP|nr:hypothetical protein CCACVL1_26683 [Corchorus capsularis]
MELCTSLTRAIPTVSTDRFLIPTPSLQSKPSLPLSLHLPPLSRSTARGLRSRGLFSSTSLLPKATTSEESSSTGPNRFFGEDSDGVATLEEVPEVDKNVYNEKPPVEEAKEEWAADQESPISEFLEKLNIKLDPEDAYPLLINGSGALAVFWLASAVVGAIDSIPVFPKLMEVVGLGYTVWFTSRYLLFKKNREELVAKVEELKQQVLGSDDE